MTPRDTTHICRRCGRRLKSAESQQLGMGPVCYAQWQKEQAKKKLFKISSLHRQDGSV